MIKRIIKQQLLRRRGINVDLKTNINYDVRVNKGLLGDDFAPIIIKESNVQFAEIGEGCFIEYACVYGNIELGQFVSISGPGAILHSEIGKIKIGNFTSIAANVSIQEFNHQLDKASTYAIHHNIFCNEKEKDWTSKGDVEIGEDVWIGSNVVVLSGIKIGRGGGMWSRKCYN